MLRLRLRRSDDEARQMVRSQDDGATALGLVRRTNVLGFAQGLFFVGMRKLSQEVRYLSYFRNPEIIKQ